MPNFNYNAKDFEEAKNWALSQPHPEVENLTLWDYFSGMENDSTMLLHMVSTYLESAV